MLDLKIHGETPKEPKKKELSLKLVQDIDMVKLIAVDEEGDRVTGGSILCITSKGNLGLFPSVCESLGLNLDSEGRIKVGS